MNDFQRVADGVIAIVIVVPNGLMRAKRKFEKTSSL